MDNSGLQIYRFPSTQDINASIWSLILVVIAVITATTITTNNNNNNNTATNTSSYTNITASLRTRSRLNCDITYTSVRQCCCWHYYWMDQCNDYVANCC